MQQGADDQRLTDIGVGAVAKTRHSPITMSITVHLLGVGSILGKIEVPPGQLKFQLFGRIIKHTQAEVHQVAHFLSVSVVGQVAVESTAAPELGIV